MKMNKKFMALTLSMALVVPSANAGLLKKAIIIGGVAYGAHAIAKNHKEKKAQEQQNNQNYQQQAPQYQNQPQYNNNRPQQNQTPGYGPDFRPASPRP